MKRQQDALSIEAARLMAEQADIRQDRDIDPTSKQEQIAILQGKINAIIELRRKDNAQRVNGVSPMEQRGRRW